MFKEKKPYVLKDLILNIDTHNSYVTKYNFLNDKLPCTCNSIRKACDRCTKVIPSYAKSKTFTLTLESRNIRYKCK